MNAQPGIVKNVQRLAAIAAGAGLKPARYAQILATRPGLGLFESHVENYFSAGGPSHHWLAATGEIYPSSVHGVGPSEEIDRDRLARRRRFTDPLWFRNILPGRIFPATPFSDLLVLPYDEAGLRRGVIGATEALGAPWID